jgi:hypothetical protein
MKTIVALSSILFSLAALAANPGDGPIFDALEKPNKHVLDLFKDASNEVYYFPGTIRFEKDKRDFAIPPLTSSESFTNLLSCTFARRPGTGTEQVEVSKMFFRVTNIGTKTITNKTYSQKYLIELAVYDEFGDLVPNHPVSGLVCATQHKVRDSTILLADGTAQKITYPQGYAFVGDKVVKLTDDDNKTASRSIH